MRQTVHHTAKRATQAIATPLTPRFPRSQRPPDKIQLHSKTKPTRPMPAQYKRDQYRRDQYRRDQYRRDQYRRDQYRHGQHRRDQYERDQYQPKRPKPIDLEKGERPKPADIVVQENAADKASTQKSARRSWRSYIPFMHSDH